MARKYGSGKGPWAIVEVQEFQGCRFRRYPVAGQMYFMGTWHGRIRALQRVVWEHYKGAIPPGYQIHHIDGNTANNAIENLSCVTHREHVVLTEQMLPEERKVARRDHMRAIQKLGAEWQGSDEGRAFHREKSLKMWETHQPTVQTCVWCGKVWGNMARRETDRFCSGKCARQWRWHTGVDHVERTCIFCGNTFKSHKSKQARFCSKYCSWNYYWKVTKGGTDGAKKSP